MNESLIIFSREWVVTAALAALLAPAYSRPATVVYDLDHLVRVLRENPHSPVVLGLRPHEQVTQMYRLQSLLTGRAVLFVGRCFYWTDYSLPEYFGMTRYGFCTWDAMRDPFSRRMELRRFRRMSVDEDDEKVAGEARQVAHAISGITDMKILERANRWLYRELAAAGLSGFEIRVLSLMTEGQKSNLPSRTRSVYKNSGLHKLGMTKHLMNLYRGVKVRPELQTGLPLQSAEGKSCNIISLRLGTS